MPQAHNFSLRLSVHTVPELIDHSFFPQPPGWNLFVKCSSH